MFDHPIVSALVFQAGYNTFIVTIGATLLGISAGGVGTFLFLRKRALVSDAVAHATLPGIAIAFMVMVGFGGDGRNLFGLLIGSFISALLGLVVIEWIGRNTRLAEDAAIGAVLSVFFGFGIVLLTIIQTMSNGRQAGLESFLLGSTAGMLFQDAVIIASGGAISLALIILLRRPMTMVSFDMGYAKTIGLPVRAIDLTIMALAMAVTVIGLKLVGLILIVALLIIPPVIGRFWANRPDYILLISGLAGGLSGYFGTAISSSASALPTGPIIVLCATTLFVFSFLFAPNRGILASAIRHHRFQATVHRHQGLIAIARGDAIHDPMTLKILKREGFIRADTTPTQKGLTTAKAQSQDEKRWTLLRSKSQDRYSITDTLHPITSKLTADEIAALDVELKMELHDARP